MKLQLILLDDLFYRGTGPQGPIGPAGPATISVGTTVTGDPGESASVTNSGTDTNAILDFVIPQGQKGNDGIGDTIFVRSTTTGEAGTEAKVIDNKVNNTHVLDFLYQRVQLDLLDPHYLGQHT